LEMDRKDSVLNKKSIYGVVFMIGS
jgi:hypothetical protein